MTRLAVPVALLLAALVAATPADVRGCGGAYHPGERVDVADETALIVWDEATKTEHFVRRATFVGDAYDFGFLVPTPSRPQLAEADGNLFDDLARMTAPRVETRYEVGLNFGCGGAKGEMAGVKVAPDGPGGAPGVVVLEQKRVGDLDATVLAFAGDRQKPDDAAGELLLWLNRNQYAVRPDLTEWLRPYAANGWVITAFKIAAQPDAGAKPNGAKGATNRDSGVGTPRGGGVRSSAVRMSFKVETSRPFFPYREPADQRDERAKGVPRLLRVFVAAKQRVAGRLGDEIGAWPGQTMWANAVTAGEWDSLTKKANLAAGSLPGDWWVTEFEDHSTPRPGTDEVYFEPARVASPVARPPIVVVERRTPLWLSLLVAGIPVAVIVVGLLLVRQATRK